MRQPFGRLALLLLFGQLYKCYIIVFNATQELLGYVFLNICQQFTQMFAAEDETNPQDRYFAFEYILKISPRYIFQINTSITFLTEIQ